MLEVQLIYKSPALGDGRGTVVLGRTMSPGVVSAVRSQLVQDAHEDAALFGGADPNVVSIYEEQADRLEQLLNRIDPEPPAPGPLRAVK